MTMADMHDFGKMDISNRGGKHDFEYADSASQKPSYGLTPSQTVGPFFAYGLTPRPYGYSYHDIHSSELLSDTEKAEEIIIEGHVFDGSGKAVHDAVIELALPNNSKQASDRKPNLCFSGFARCGTGANGPDGDTRFVFRIQKPGMTSQKSAPCVTFIIMMRGLLNHCVTRCYLPSENLGDDTVLQQVPNDRRHTLIAQEISKNHFRFDIHMQGENETVFFDI